MITNRIHTETFIDLNKVKAHLRVESESENEYIEDLIEYAITNLEDQICGNIRPYRTTITESSVENGDYIKLTNYESIVSVKSGSDTIPTTDYLIGTSTNDIPYIYFSANYNNVEIIYNESYIKFKPYIKHAVNLLIADWYENRENMSLENGKISLSSSALSRIISMLGAPIK